VAEATTTYNFRRRLARHFYDGSALPQVAMMAFGDGGHNAMVRRSRPMRRAPRSIMRYCESHWRRRSKEDAYSVTGDGRIEKSELIGAHISEAALLDENGEHALVSKLCTKDQGIRRDV